MPGSPTKSPDPDGGESVMVGTAKEGPNGVDGSMDSKPINLRTTGGDISIVGSTRDNMVGPNQRRGV
ncbi:hypothetical protein A2U01_0027277, partial [Trifolium medium]|nr:hypothetical protein [Trifolium medium]